MPVTLRMAFRNLLEHKAKSLIVGILLSLGVLILVLGNSFLEASRRGIEASFTANYTGELIVTGVADGPVSLFGVQSVGGLDATPIIPDYEKVFAQILSTPGVMAASGVASGFGRIIDDESSSDLAMGSPMSGARHGGSEEGEEDEDEDDMSSSFVMLFGIDAENYWKLFTNIEVVTGSTIQPGQPGLMVAHERLETISKGLKRDLAIGDEVLIQGFSGSGMRLRGVPLVGTFRQISEGAGPEQLSYIDIDSLRVLNSMTVGSAEGIELDQQASAMLAIDDLDTLFSDDLFVDDVAGGSTVAGTVPSGTAAGSIFTDESLDNILGDTSGRERLNVADTGAWHSIVVRLDDPARVKQTVAELNAWFAAEGIQALAGDWQKAAGPYAQSVDVLRIVFTIAIIILAVVAVIIIMNTLVVSVIERTGEIGTMRALGAGKGFVRRMFAAETVTLALAFGIIGILLSFVAVGIINALGIEASNPFLEILFGGKVLRAIVQPLSVLGALVLITIVGLAASIYPVSVALRIQPVQAMQTE
jgi:putative ABC transport system permease protein